MENEHNENQDQGPDDGGAAAKAVDPNVGGGVDREKLDASDFVFPKERKFPVVTPGDVSDAVSSWGRYKGPESFETFKRRLIALCKRKGEKFIAALPDEWEVGGGKSVAVKFLRDEDGGAVVGGHLLLWGDPDHKDLQGEYFTKSTALWLDRYQTVPALFHHGLDGAIGLTAVGRRVKAVPDEVGVWVEHWLDTASKYWAMVKPLLEKEALFYSPGSAPHLVKRLDDGELLSFPVVEDTLTVAPAQHRLRPVGEIKAAYKAAGLDFPLEEDGPEEGDSGDDAGASCCGESDRLKARAIEILASIELQKE